MELISQSQLKLTKSCLISKQTEVSHNRFLHGIFENLDVDYQMLMSLGKNELFIDPEIYFFVP